MRIGITGSPKTGKTVIGSAISNLLKCSFYDLNDIIIDRRLGRFEGVEFVVEMRKARKTISEMLRHDSNFVVSGLLLPHLVPNKLLDHVAVLRCNPKILYERYRQAGYSEKKARENVVAEAIGILYSESIKVYGEKVFQVDVSEMNVDKASESILKKKGEDIDWLREAENDPELLRLLL